MNVIKRSALILAMALASSTAQDVPWWDGGFVGAFQYRFIVEITNRDTAKDDYPITLWIDFTQKLLALGEIGALDQGAIRVMQESADSAGGFGDPIRCLFEDSPDYGSISRARGWLSWVVPGRMEPGEMHRFHIYFDLQKHGVKPEDVPLPWEAICYSPLNKVLGSSLEPEAAVAGFSRSCWKGWGSGGQPDSIMPYGDGHWGRWSLALTSGGGLHWEALVGLLEPGRSYLIGGYLKSAGHVDEGTSLKASFVSGGIRPTLFSREIELDVSPGWWRVELPLPVAPDSGLFALTFDVEGSSPDTLWIDDLFIFEDPPFVNELPAEKLP